MVTSAQLRREILAGQWDEALCTLYGTEPAVLARQRQRYAAALEQFELYYGPGRQVHVYSAPGRAELGGNHTDHQHGYGLAAAVTLDLVAVASPSDDGFIRVKSRGFNKLDVIDLSEAEPQQGESTHSASLIRALRKVSGHRERRWVASMPIPPAMCSGAAGFPVRRLLRWGWRPS